MTKTLCCYIIGCFQPIRLNAFLKESLYLCMDSPQSHVWSVLKLVFMTLQHRLTLLSFFLTDLFYFLFIPVFKPAAQCVPIKL